MTRTVGHSIAVLDAVTPSLPASDTAHALVRTIRAEDAVAGAAVVVTGDTRVRHRLRQLHRPADAVGGGLRDADHHLVLFLLLRSVILPIKAVLMNLLSLSAAFGAMVWIFQDGHCRACSTSRRRHRPDPAGAALLCGLRAVHGLRGLPAHPYAGGVAADSRQPCGRGRGAGAQRTPRDRRGRDHDHRLPCVRAGPGHHHQGNRHRHGGCGAGRRHPGARAGRARVDATARQTNWWAPRWAQRLPRAAKDEAA